MLVLAVMPPLSLHPWHWLSAPLLLAVAVPVALVGVQEGEGEGERVPAAVGGVEGEVERRPHWLESVRGRQVG